MKKMIGILISAMGILLVAGIAHAQSDSGTAQASVTVNTFIDITVTACPGGGSLTYGSQDPGAADVPASCQDNTDPALRTTVEATTNQPVDLSLSGTDYTGPGAEEIAVENTNQNTVNNTGTYTAFAADPGSTTVFTSVGGTGSAVDNELWFWLSIPNVFLTAGQYTSDYTLQTS